MTVKSDNVDAEHYELVTYELGAHSFVPKLPWQHNDELPEGVIDLVKRITERHEAELVRLLCGPAGRRDPSPSAPQPKAGKMHVADDGRIWYSFGSGLPWNTNVV